MNLTGSVLTAFLVGLLGGAHCIGMCGGIVGTLTAGLPGATRSSLKRIFPFQLAYNVGRIAGYTIAGALMGAVGAFTFEVMPLQYAQRALYALAAVVMVLLGLYLGGWWRALAVVERLGGLLWRRLEPLGRHLLPVRTPVRALGIGFLWAWIPCGLVYSVLIWAIAAGSPLRGALLMLAFGIGTLPNLLAMGMLAGVAARFSSRKRIRQVTGVLVIGFGVYGLSQVYFL